MTNFLWNNDNPIGDKITKLGTLKITHPQENPQKAKVLDHVTCKNKNLTGQITNGAGIRMFHS